jgi:hypothetical protein
MGKVCSTPGMEKNAIEIFVGLAERKRKLGSTRRISAGRIKINLREI